jgi:hypothetical protein
MDILDASIVDIAWFIIKICLAIAMIAGIFRGIGYGIVSIFERSNGSIGKAVLKVASIVIIGGVLAFYLGEGVQHFFGESRTPTAGGIVNLLLLLLYGLANLTGISYYTSASIFAIIIWIGIMLTVAEAFFENSKDEPIAETKHEKAIQIYEEKKSVTFFKRAGIIFLIYAFLYYITPTDKLIGKEEVTFILPFVIFSFVWLFWWYPQAPLTKEEEEIQEGKEALKELKDFAKKNKGNK